MPLIRIVATPIGEAPEEIRRAWIGIVLPLPAGPHGKKRRIHVTPAITGYFGFWSGWWARLRGKLEKREGYVVPASIAFDALALHSPETLAWWKANAPHLFKTNCRLFFSADACKYEP